MYVSRFERRIEHPIPLDSDEQATPERWSAKAKTEVILRLFRGERVGAVSREIQVPVHEIENWRKESLEGGVVRLKKRGVIPTNGRCARRKRRSGN